MLEFDVSDFVYLDSYKLYREGTALGTYLRWLMTANLQSKVPEHLHRPIWGEAEALRVLDEASMPTGVPIEDALVKAFERPSRALQEAYASVVMDQTRSTVSPFPAPIARDNIVEGDLFVERRDGAYAGAQVLIVLTPTCDLVLRGGRTTPKAASVLLLPGTLRRVDITKSEVEYVRVASASSGGGMQIETFTVEWNYKAVSSLPWRELSSGALDGYDRLGRMREPYFDHVRDRFTESITKKGWQVLPLDPAACAGEVHVRTFSKPGRPEYKLLFSFHKEEELVWTFLAAIWRVKPASEPTPVAGGPKAPASVGPAESDKFLVHATRAFLDRLAGEIARTDIIGEPERSRLSERCASFDLLVSILRPGKPGVRLADGQGIAFEIKESLGPPRNTTADVVLAVAKPTG